MTDHDALLFDSLCVEVGLGLKRVIPGRADLLSKAAEGFLNATPEDVRRRGVELATMIFAEIIRGESTRTNVLKFEVGYDNKPGESAK